MSTATTVCSGYCMVFVVGEFLQGQIKLSQYLLAGSQLVKMLMLVCGLLPNGRILLVIGSLVSCNIPDQSKVSQQFSTFWDKIVFTIEWFNHG